MLAYKNNIVLIYIMPRVSDRTPEQRAEARREYKRNYYQKNKNKQLIYNMRYRHKKNPPEYIKSIETLNQKKQDLYQIFIEEIDYINLQLKTLHDWDPLKDDIKNGIKVNNKTVFIDFR